ncbi:unnamed protein product [[Actinomadura] parvosata subsp. kistnae]|nr:unnamed protein product [Actinomadura parvosata subsp. kistnae]
MVRSLKRCCAAASFRNVSTPMGNLRASLPLWHGAGEDWRKVTLHVGSRKSTRFLIDKVLTPLLPKPRLANPAVMSKMFR